MPIVHLENRSVIAISGKDRQSFLQGLITNDIQLLEEQEAIYACFLTPQGKFLFDFFIIEDGERYLLDVEASRTQDFIGQLSLYKLRSDVQIEAPPELKCYALWGVDEGYEDPRHKDLGHRSISNTLEADTPFEVYDQKRIQLAIPDGMNDLKPQLSTLHEGNLDQLHAISWSKGCYLGQELTARIEHRGLVKKRLLPVTKGDRFELELIKLSDLPREDVVVPEYLKEKV